MILSRLKKWGLCTGLLVSFAATTVMAESVTINNATVMDVKSYILANRELRHPNSTVSLIPNHGSSFQMGSSSYETIVFKSTKKLRVGLFGEASVKTNRDTYFSISTPLNRVGVKVSYFESTELYNPNKGKFDDQITSTNESEAIILNKIKLHFDGGYTDGYTLSREKGKKGYQIEKINPHGPAEKAGLKIGDVVVKINGQKVNFEKDLNTFNISNDIGKKETETVTIITDSGLEKDIVIETAYWNPQTGMFE